ncbi:MAG: hypothetical protein MUC65_05875 [Pontiellaceae bacterium]|nr:hypothetical protein [Pontiellaceae bacterium]
MKLKNFLPALAAVGSVVLGETEIKIGDPVSLVLTTLGEPQGIAEMNGTTFYVYDGENVVVKDGKVISLPENFVSTVQRKRADKEKNRKNEISRIEFEAAQKAKGLVLYKNQWLTPDELAKAKKGNDDVIKRAKAALDMANFLNGGVRYADIVCSPEKYLGGAEHVLRGRFCTVNSDRKSFEITQGNCSIEVKYSRLPKEKTAQLLKEAPYSGTPVEVRGAVVKHADAEKYYIDAKSVSFYTAP